VNATLLRFDLEFLAIAATFTAEADRSAFGWTSLTFNARPSRSLPLSPLMARSASALLLISTNPKPLACGED